MNQMIRKRQHMVRTTDTFGDGARFAAVSLSVPEWEADTEPNESPEATRARRMHPASDDALAKYKRIERRRIVAEMANEGLTVRDISEALEEKRTTIQSDVQFLIRKGVIQTITKGTPGARRKQQDSV